MHGMENVKKKIIFSFFIFNKDSRYGEFGLAFLVSLHSEHGVRSALD